MYVARLHGSLDGGYCVLAGAASKLPGYDITDVNRWSDFQIQDGEEVGIDN